MSKFIDQVEDTDGIPLVDDDDESPWQRAADQLTPNTGIPEALHGNPELEQQLTELCNEFSDIFSTEFKTEPADIPPMERNQNHSRKMGKQPKSHVAHRDIRDWPTRSFGALIDVVMV